MILFLPLKSWSLCKKYCKLDKYNNNYNNFCYLSLIVYQTSLPNINSNSGNINLQNPENREGILTSLKSGFEMYSTWKNGKLNGETILDDSRAGKTISVYKSGVKHGICRKFGLAKNRIDNFKFIGWFDSGKAKGVIWKGLFGGAFLIGNPDSEGKAVIEFCFISRFLKINIQLLCIHNM